MRCCIRHLFWGAHGAIAAILTAVPELCVACVDACRAGDHKKALDLHEKLLPIWNAIFDDNLPANTKYAMKLQGRDGGVPRPPMPPSSADQEGTDSGGIGECRRDLIL